MVERQVHEKAHRQERQHEYGANGDRDVKQQAEEQAPGEHDEHEAPENIGRARERCRQAHIDYDETDKRYARRRDRDVVTLQDRMESRGDDEAHERAQHVQTQDVEHFRAGCRSEDNVGDRERQDQTECENPRYASADQVLLNEALAELLLDESLEAQVAEAVRELLSIR